MFDRLLYEKKEVTVDMIKRKVSKITNVDLKFINLSNHDALARKREYVNARQISMSLSKKYTHESLASIGWQHGERDHATVLHACKTINDLLDVRNKEVMEPYSKAISSIDKWLGISIDKYKTIKLADKIRLLKVWIRNHVPLDVRQRLLSEYGNICPTCGNLESKKKCQ